MSQYYLCWPEGAHCNSFTIKIKTIPLHYEFSGLAVSSFSKTCDFLRRPPLLDGSWVDLPILRPSISRLPVGYPFCEYSPLFLCSCRTLAYWHVSKTHSRLHAPCLVQPGWYPQEQGAWPPGPMAGCGRPGLSPCPHCFMEFKI